MSQSLAVRLVKEISGQAAVITVPRVYLQATKDHMVAVVLAQLVYHQGRSREEWFHISDEQLGEEVCVTSRQLYSIRSKLEAFGVETERRGAPARMFYRVDLEKLASQLFQEEGLVLPNGRTSSTVSGELVLTKTVELISTCKKELKERGGEVELSHFQPIDHTPPPKEEVNTTVSGKPTFDPEELRAKASEPSQAEIRRKNRQQYEAVRKELTADLQMRLVEIRNKCPDEDQFLSWVSVSVFPQIERLREKFADGVRVAVEAYTKASDQRKWGRDNFSTALSEYLPQRQIRKAVTYSSGDFALPDNYHEMSDEEISRYGLPPRQRAAN